MSPPRWRRAKLGDASWRSRRSTRVIERRLRRSGDRLGGPHRRRRQGARRQGEERACSRGRPRAAYRQRPRRRLPKLLFDEASRDRRRHRRHARGDMIGRSPCVEMGADAVDIGKTIHPHRRSAIDQPGRRGLRGTCTDLPPVRRCSGGYTAGVRRSRRRRAGLRSSARGQLRRPEGELVRDLVFREQARLDVSGGREVGVEQARAVEQVHLADAPSIRVKRPCISTRARPPRRSRGAPSMVVSPSSMKPAGRV